MYSQLGIFS